MENKSKKKRYYTFMIVPHDASRAPLSLRVPVVCINFAVFLILFSLLVVGSSFVYSSLLSRRLIYYANTLAQNRKQQEMINSFTQDTQRVNQAILELVLEDNRLRKLLGLGVWKTKVKLERAGSLMETTDQVSRDLESAKIKINDRKESLYEMKKWVSEIRQRYAYTPSCWPVYGRVVSRFGYRIYPWRGFHTGIDISARYGTPVRATANGAVSFVGWAKGYGRAVIIKHGYGKSSLYAHNSHFAVKQGEKIRKGQIISYVGNTGYSTGPHLHYEVMDGDKRVNPVAYLDLNVLSASRIWRQ